MGKRKVVLFAESPWREEYNSGVGRAMQVDKEGLEERGWEVYAVFPSYGKPAGEREFRLRSVRTNPFDKDSYRLAWPSDLAPDEYKRLLVWLKDIKADILYLQGTHQVADYGFRAGKELGIPVITRIHTFDSFYIWSTGEGLVQTTLVPVKLALACLQAKRSRRITMGSDLTVFPTPWFLKKYCEDTGHDPETGHSIVHPSLVPEVKLASKSELDQMSYNLRARKFGINAQKFPMILSGVRVTKVKNLEFLIYTMAEIGPLLGPNLPFIHPGLVFVGNGDAKYIRKLKTLAVDLGVEKWLNFAGELPHDQAMIAMQCAEITPIPSFSETRCLVHDEAGLCRTLSLVMEGTPMADSADPGQVLPPKPKVWAEYIVKLLSHKELLQSLVETSYNRAKQQADPDLYFGGLIALFEGLLVKTK